MSALVFCKKSMLKKPLLSYIAALILLSFLGSVILLLPGMSKQPEGISFIDALFTAASAVTLTGLSTLNLGSSFTNAGQTVILFLFQLSGLMIVIAALYFAHLLNIKNGIIPKQNALKKIIKRVFYIALFIEIPAIIAVFSLWGRRLELDGTANQLFYSVFHAVSGFTNTGFTLFEGGFSHPDLKTLYIFQLAMAVFMFLGAIGFPAIYDLISLKHLRERMLDPKKDWELNTRVIIYGSIILISIVAASIYFSENDRQLSGQKTVEAWISVIFQAVSARSAGFSALQFSGFTLPLLWLFLFIMFIGGSSASMAGGIKVQTLYLLFNRNNKNQVKHQVLGVLLKVLLFSILLVLSVSVILYFLSADDSYFPLLFETVSAFGSSGFSTGVTASLSSFGKFLIIITMLSGRIIFPGLLFHLLLKQNIQPETDILPG